MSDRIPMTRSGYDKLKAEVDELETVEMPKLAQRVAAARSEGDLSENAEYHGARESQGMLQAKINLLRDKLARAVIVERARPVASASWARVQGLPSRRRSKSSPVRTAGVKHMHDFAR